MGKKTKVGKTRKDKFYRLAKETGFRSRAAFKLIQLNRKFSFLQQSQVCIDLCAAPGGWMQVAKQNMPVSSIIIGVDLYPIKAIPGCISLVEDITTEKCKAALSGELKDWKADVVLHDGAPNVGKNWLFDSYQQICLTLQALKLASNFLRSNGWFVSKVFRSKDYNAFLWVLKQLFKKVYATKPSASRKESAEIFVVCQGYLAPAKIDPRLLDPKYIFQDLELEGQTKSSLLQSGKTKRVKAEGYTAKEVSLRNDLSATDFMQNDNALLALQGIGSIKIDDESVRQHERTTAEILECCKDINVLGRKEIKGLLLWHKHVKAELFKKEDDKLELDKENKTENKLTSTTDADEDENKEIAELEEEEEKASKRKKKKMLKQKSQLTEKMNLKMVIRGDAGPREEGEEGVFDLRAIKNAHDVEKLQDVAPEDVADNTEVNGIFIPKYTKYNKDINPLHEFDSGEEDKSENGVESDDEMDYTENCFGENDTTAIVGNSKKRNQRSAYEDGDYRNKDTKRQQRVQLWYEKNNLQELDIGDDEDYDLEKLTKEYKTKGIKSLGDTEDSINRNKTPINKQGKGTQNMVKKSTTDLTPIEKVPKKKLNESELAIGALMVKGVKRKSELIDAAWNRYAFNDDNLPAWFVQDEDINMRQPVPVPPELQAEYDDKLRELNVRPIKKVMEAKVRKKRRATKRIEKAKKKAEQILEHSDSTAREKMRQIKKLYKKAEDKKTEVSYVVAKKHLSGKRVRRPPDVKGRFKVVDPRQKKDKRSVQKKSNKKRKF